MCKKCVMIECLYFKANIPVERQTDENFSVQQQQSRCPTIYVLLHLSAASTHIKHPVFGNTMSL